jgi:hypothetical protein
MKQFLFYRAVAILFYIMQIMPSQHASVQNFRILYAICIHIAPTSEVCMAAMLELFVLKNQILQKNNVSSSPTASIRNSTNIRRLA